MQVLRKEHVEETEVLPDGLPYKGEDWKEIHFRMEKDTCSNKYTFCSSLYAFLFANC